ncbi:hypothetical protein ABTE65_18640, partial [Acinetobacter baumannii]
ASHPVNPEIPRASAARGRWQHANFELAIPGMHAAGVADLRASFFPMCREWCRQSGSPIVAAVAAQVQAPKR